MDENKEKQELNDELLEQVSGGNVYTDPPKFVPEARQKPPQDRCQEMHVLQPDYPF